MEKIKKDYIISWRKKGVEKRRVISRVRKREREGWGEKSASMEHVKQSSRVAVRDKEATKERRVMNIDRLRYGDVSGFGSAPVT